MTLSGPDALRALEEALRDVRRDEDEIARRVSRSAELVTRMREQEGELLRQLGHRRLDSARQAELATMLESAQRNARDMLDAHEAELDRADALLRGIDDDIAAKVTARAALQADAERYDAQLEALSERVKPDLARDPTYRAKLDEARQLAAIAAQSMRKTEQAESDREQKGRPYRDDPLLMYLWEAGFGTRNYRANPLVATLDGWVARLAGFAEARPRFSMLNEIPMRLRDHAERQRSLADEAAAELAASEQGLVDAAGGTVARGAIEDLSQRIAGLDAEIVELQDRRDEAVRAQRQLVQGMDPAFANAIAGLATALGREEFRALLAEARSNGTMDDATIVQKIDDARQRAGEEESERREQRARLTTLAQRRRELENLITAFKTEGFDNPRSAFGDDSLAGQQLLDFLRGSITATAYAELWKRGQSWTGPRKDWQFKSEPPQDSLWGNFRWERPRQPGGYGGPGGGWGRLS